MQVRHFQYVESLTNLTQIRTTNSQGSMLAANTLATVMPALTGCFDECCFDCGEDLTFRFAGGLLVILVVTNHVTRIGWLVVVTAVPVPNAAGS